MENENFENKQIATMQLIADNKAAKRILGDKTLFRIELALIFLNFIAAVLTLIIDCPCEDKPWWHWLIFGIYVAILIAVLVLNLIDNIDTHKKRRAEDVDQKAKSGKMPLDQVLQMYIDDTKEVEKQIKATRIKQFITALITVISTIVVIVVLSFR